MSINGRYNIRRNLQEDDDGDYSESDENAPFVKHRRRRLVETIIPSNSLMLITLTNISSTNSLRPVEGVLNYKLTSFDGNPLEIGEINLVFQNKFAAQMDPNKAGVSPNLWDEGQISNYTLIFTPVGYEMNMTLDVYIDRRIGIPGDFGSTN
jgi:hypothetical protein